MLLSIRFCFEYNCLYTDWSKYLKSPLFLSLDIDNVFFYNNCVGVKYYFIKILSNLASYSLWLVSGAIFRHSILHLWLKRSSILQFKLIDWSCVLILLYFFNGCEVDFECSLRWFNLCLWLDSQSSFLLPYFLVGNYLWWFTARSSSTKYTRHLLNGSKLPFPSSYEGEIPIDNSQTTRIW